VTLRARIWLLLLVAVILVLVAAVALRSGYTTVATTTSDVTSRLQPAAQGVSSLNTALAEMDSAVTAYALTEDVVDLSSYVEGTARADAEFARLKTLFEGQPQLTRLLGDTRDAYRIWKQQGTRPIIEATRKGDRVAARALVRTGTSRNLYNDVRTYTHALEDQIRIRREAAATIQADQFVRLSRILNISILVFFGLLAMFSLLLLRGVLRPLRELQDQLVEVAQDGHHEEPIVPSGPPELRDVGQDAETMRRTLTREVDRARQADEGLTQQRPVVAAIRAELADSHSEPVTGLDFAGVQEPAEGGTGR
jgi:CHASE3 domain sensor protein